MKTRWLPSGTLVNDRYRITGHLGDGESAAVYRGWDTALEREVALKILHPHLAQDPATGARFMREAGAAAVLYSKHVVAVFDRGSWDGTYYIVMECVEGGTLKQLVFDCGPLTPYLAIGLTIQILRAARFAHRKGIIHRDFKSQNVLIDHEGTARVIDFGIAIGGWEDRLDPDTLVGTPQYMSPEQAEGREITQQSDLYSIGVILYEMLTGRVPFDGDSGLAVASRHSREKPVPPASRSHEVGPELNQVVMRALEKKPQDRYEDADAFIAVLVATLKTVPVTSSRPFPRVFLCHSSPDKAAVRALYSRLRRDRLSPWFDEEHLQPGQDFDLSIRRAIRESEFVVVCLSAASTTRAGYVHKEIKQALDVADEQPEGAVFVIPVRLEDCAVPDRLRHLHWVDLFDGGYDQLAQTLRSRTA